MKIAVAIVSVAFVSGQTTRPQRPAPRAQQRPVSSAPQRQAPNASPASDVAAERAVVDQYCVVGHNQKLKTANLLLDQLDLAHVSNHAEVVEKVVRKLGAGMMPPSGMPRPDPAVREKSHLLGL